MTKFIAFASGKGGVGKTTTTLNVGHALHNLDRKVVLLDGNLTTPNLALHLGLINPEGTLNKFLRKEKSLKEIMYKHESGLSVIPSSPSFDEFQKTNVQSISKVFDALQGVAEFVLIDAPSGLGYDVSQLIKQCDETIVVVNPTLSSVMDALKTIQLAKAHGNAIAGVILNLTNRGKFEMTEAEIQNILGHPILANVRNHKKMRKALHKQTSFHHMYPRSRNAKQYKKVAKHLALDQEL